MCFINNGYYYYYQYYCSGFLLGWEYHICSFLCNKFRDLDKTLWDPRTWISLVTWPHEYTWMKPLLPNAEQHASNVSVTETGNRKEKWYNQGCTNCKILGPKPMPLFRISFWPIPDADTKVFLLLFIVTKKSKSNQSLQKRKWTILSHSANQRYSIYDTNSKGALWSFCVVLEASRCEQTPFLD